MARGHLMELITSRRRALCYKGCDYTIYAYGIDELTRAPPTTCSSAMASGGESTPDSHEIQHEDSTRTRSRSGSGTGKQLVARNGEIGIYNVATS